MTKGRLDWHVKQFKEMRLLASTQNFRNKEELIKEIESRISLINEAVNYMVLLGNGDVSDFESYAQHIEDLRWARAQVL